MSSGQISRDGTSPFILSWVLNPKCFFLCSERDEEEVGEGGVGAE